MRPNRVWKRGRAAPPSPPLRPAHPSERSTRRGVDHRLRDGAAPLLLTPCPRERSAEKVAPPFGQGPGVGGTARMGGGTQPARQAPPPSICVRACGDAPPPFCPAPCTCNGAAQNPKACEPGALKGSGPRPALRVCTTPRAFRVPDPYAPPFACHAHVVPHAGRRAQGGMRKVGCRGQAHGTTRGVVRTPPPRRCASRKQRGSNPHRPHPPQMGVRREEGCRNGVRTHRSPFPARTPSPSLRLSPFARNEGLGSVQTEGGGVE